MAEIVVIGAGVGGLGAAHAAGTGSDGEGLAAGARCRGDWQLTTVALDKPFENL